MFGRQASSPSRTGTLLLMVALVTGVRLTESTSKASDNVGGGMAKNAFASFNLTGRGQSMLRSFDAPPKGLGLTPPNDVTFPKDATFPGGFTFHPSPFFTCFVPCATQEVLDKAAKCMAAFKPPTVNGSEVCDYMRNFGQCCIDAACTCSDDSSKKISDDMLVIMKRSTICGDKANRLSCSSNLLWIILAVVGGVIVVIVVIAVVVCCCCMGGGGKRKHSKHSSKRSSKSKLRKGSSKHRGSSRH